MIKRSTAIIILCLFLVSACEVYAEDLYTQDGPVRKLGRGVANVITSPLEITKGVQDVNMESGVFAAATWGIGQGIVKTLIRAGVGIYEIATFPLGMGNDYEPILTDPEFFLEEN